MAVSAQELLDSVEAAILAFTTNGAISSYQIAAAGGGSRSVARSNLRELMQLRKDLRAEVASQQDGGTHFNYARRGPI